MDHPGRRQLGARLVQSLQEQFRNERRPPDGLIYPKLRLYEGELDQPADRDAANKWWAILQNHPATKKHKYLRAFFRHGSFPQAFDTLLPIPGLWAGMQIGVLHTLVSLRCDEVGDLLVIWSGASPAADNIATRKYCPTSSIYDTHSLPGSSEMIWSLRQKRTPRAFRCCSPVLRRYRTMTCIFWRKR